MKSHMAEPGTSEANAHRSVARIIDVHHHIGALATGMASERDDSSDDDRQPIEVHRQMLRTFGMAAAAVTPGFQYDRTRGLLDTQDINTAVVAYRDRDPSHFPVALGILEPLHQVAANIDELDRLVEELAVDAISWHTRFQGVFLSDRRMHELVDLVAERGLPCFIHMFSESAMESPWMLLELAKEHPNATFVALDGFSGATNVRYMDLVADSVENVLFDTAIAFPLQRPLDSFVTRFGSERLLFGTDSYAQPLMYNTPGVLHELLASPMSQDDLENIMWRNFIKLFPQAAPRLGL